MKHAIPAPVISVISRILPDRYSAEGLNNLFDDAGAPGEIPEGSKAVRAETWLRRANKDESVDSLKVLGKVIETLMEGLSLAQFVERDADHRAQIEQILGKCKLSYLSGGRVVGQLGVPSRNLEALIKGRYISSIDLEFERAMDSIETAPREAISAASNILESVCKIYIEEHELDMPAKQDLQSVWNVVRKCLGIDPSIVVDQDLRKILTGLFSIVDGIGSLRTHASSAHGSGSKSYKIEPRHARLSVHASHTVAIYILEAWKKNTQ